MNTSVARKTQSSSSCAGDSLSIRLLPNGESMSCVACHYFTLKANLAQKLYKSTKWTACCWGQEKSAQNTATAKTHFYTLKNITRGCQIIFRRTKRLSKSLIETKGCLGVLQKEKKKKKKRKKTLRLHLCRFPLTVTLGHNESVAWPGGAEPNRWMCVVKYQKIHRRWSEKQTCFCPNPAKVSVRFLRRAAVFLKVIATKPDGTQSRAERNNWWNPDLRIRMRISHSCCFWQHSLIIGNKLTWKRPRLVSLSAPLSIQICPPHPPHLLQLPPPSRLSPPPTQPPCPLVSGHLAWQSIILTAPRERKRKRQRDRKTGGYFDFQTWAPIFFFFFPSCVPPLPHRLPPFISSSSSSFLLSPFLLFFLPHLYSIYF